MKSLLILPLLNHIVFCSCCESGHTKSLYWSLECCHLYSMVS